MPYRKKGESKQAYVGRFLRSAEAKKSFPKRKQRIAVALSMARKKGK